MKSGKIGNVIARFRKISKGIKDCPPVKSFTRAKEAADVVVAKHNELPEKSSFLSQAALKILKLQRKIPTSNTLPGSPQSHPTISKFNSSQVNRQEVNYRTSIINNNENNHINDS